MQAWIFAQYTEEGEEKRRRRPREHPRRGAIDRVGRLPAPAARRPAAACSAARWVAACWAIWAPDDAVPVSAARWARAGLRRMAAAIADEIVFNRLNKTSVRLRTLVSTCRSF